MNGQPVERRVAIVTGGTSGIGLATVRALAADGIEVVLCGRTEERVSATAKELHSEGVNVAGYPCDVRDRDAVQTFVDTVAERHGAPSVLVNNAGRGGGGPTAHIADDLWLDAVDTNLNSVFWVTRAVLNAGGMAADGRIVAIASTGGKQGVPFGAPYSAAKAGVIGFTKALAKELAPTGTTVNAVCPGYTETPMAVDVREQYAAMQNSTPDAVLAQFEAKIPLGRYSTPDEVAAMVRYLVSPEAASVTAQALNICGGLGSF
ncbi:SDR family NAD(P)-dependent oxidoreductase [Amycolatopsis keratiniphila]|uniref:Ketoacyl reductase n=1 Tax=Amycolatopsis keratiniphila subsp. keratiniphila TaxID=227715 RepID=A0A1W2M2Z1_9PSEU|nr:SDR family NAD(P)-dependent oxidoreductase [Amycolatopsis keratiniphila]ONF74392.1 ketoacyl reductase [Amycolatopsis keratiniphila subsp. keratiniphila]